MSGFLAGFAEAEFTPEPGLLLFGQMYPRRAERTRDPLMACAAAFAEPDGAPVVLVSADVCVLPTNLVRQIQHCFHQRSGIPGERLLVHSTHTHVAPATIVEMGGDTDAAFLDRLQDSIVSAAAAAVARLEPALLFAGCGSLAEMGWNRRALFADGKARMYGHSGQPGFVRMEGPRDPALPLLIARRPDGAINGVILGFSTHPNALENSCVYSADIPGAARAALKAALGSAVGVVYFTGAAGNTAPSILDPYRGDQPWRGDPGVERSGYYVAGEALKVIAAAVDPDPAPVVRLESTRLQVPLRQWPGREEPSYPSPLVDGSWPDATAYYRQAEADWPALAAQPVETAVNVLRLGGTAVCTSPAELFVEFGLEIKADSPATVTLISQLTDGYVGYVPTPLAFEHGGYETWCAPTSLLSRDAGRQIVAETKRLLQMAFDGTGCR